MGKARIVNQGDVRFPARDALTDETGKLFNRRAGRVPARAGPSGIRRLGQKPGRPRRDPCPGLLLDAQGQALQARACPEDWVGHVFNAGACSRRHDDADAVIGEYPALLFPQR